MLHRMEQAIAKPHPRYRSMTNSPVVVLRDAQAGASKKGQKLRTNPPLSLHSPSYTDIIAPSLARAATQMVIHNSHGKSRVVKMCHIIPPQHFGVYPVSRSVMKRGDDYVAQVAYDPRFSEEWYSAPGLLPCSVEGPTRRDRATDLRDSVP